MAVGPNRGKRLNKQRQMKKGQLRVRGVRPTGSLKVYELRVTSTVEVLPLAPAEA